jgi:hypothetical protein
MQTDLQATAQAWPESRHLSVDCKYQYLLEKATYHKGYQS